jgi:sulfotransferase family protein
MFAWSLRRAFFFTHHKCASTWLGIYLQEVAKLNSQTLGATPSSQEIPADPIVLLRNASYHFVKSRCSSGCHVIRNPLSVVASAYFSHRQTHPVEGWPELQVQQPLLRSVDRTTGFYLTLAFLERPDFYPGTIGPLCGLRAWDYDDPAYLTLRAEDLVLRPSEAIGQAFAFMGVRCQRLPDDQDFTFERFSGGRLTGQVNEASHYRSGSPSDWREQLPRAVIDYVIEHFRPMLERFYPESLSN